MPTEPAVHDHASGAAVGALRRIYNPVQQNSVTFLETSAQTNGARTLLELELAPGGSTTPHYHRRFSERFEVRDGELHLQIGRTRSGGSRSASRQRLNRIHCTHSRTQPQHPTRFLIELRPGHSGIEQGLQIVYGLASEGKTNAKGVPNNLYHLAVVLELGDTQLPGVLRVLLPVLRVVTGTGTPHGHRAGADRALLPVTVHQLSTAAQSCDIRVG